MLLEMSCRWWHDDQSGARCKLSPRDAQGMTAGEKSLNLRLTMGAHKWIVLILVIFARILVATEKVTQLSFVIICCLLGFFSMRRIEAYRRRSKVKQWRLDAREVNDSLYELYKPAGVPTLQVLFFHGLPFGDFVDPYLSTWESGDGSCIWPKTWLAKEFPDAHILVVSYCEGLKKRSAGSFDMRNIRENLTSDLIQANVGQTADCPVVLVGHSFGGLVIKDLCLEVHNTLISRTDNPKVQKFLDNLRGVFYYSTPHHGSPHIGRAASVLSGPLFNYFKVLSTDAARLNYDFNRLCNSYPKLQIAGLGERLPVKWGIFQGIIIVPEASARDGENFNLESSADHFSVCRPEKTTSRRFNALTRLLGKICDDLKDKKAMAQTQAVRQNSQHLPKQMINRDGVLEEVKSRLKNFTTLGFVGMGGLGKTTLAKAVFNELCAAYEYSCFVPDVRLIEGTVEQAKQVVWKHMHRFGRKVGETDDLSDLTGKALLLVLDDISGDRDITILSHLVHHSSPESRFIVTSRDWILLRSLDDIYEMPLLDKRNAQKLFLSHACPSQANLPANLERDMVAVVAKCGGLPLTLEVLGSYLKLKKDGKFWKQTLQALEEAEAIEDIEKRLWAKLTVSYDGLHEVEQQMFLDATTFFSHSLNGYISLREAKAAWRKAYRTEYETLRWQNLVDRSLVYDVEDDESIRVHDQLLSLGRKIALASESSENCKRRLWDEKVACKQLMEDAENQDVHALRLSIDCDSQERGTIHISGQALPKLKKLQYLEVDGPVFLDEVEKDTSFPSKLVLLKCIGRLDTFDLALQDRLVVLDMSGVEVLPSSIGQLSALRIFIGEDLKSVPDEFGDLSQLEYLEFRDCVFLESLPGTFGKLSQLESLKFRFCHRLQLPETFGGLSNLKYLELKSCWGLRSLPQSFGNLAALDHLVLSRCDELVALPNSIGNLSALKHLNIGHCEELHSLPDSFRKLSALKHLKLSDCEFEVPPNSLGKLSTLRHLQLQDCGSLISMITFGQLTELQYLEISGKGSLIVMERLPESLAQLTALTHLVLDCLSIKSIPDFIRSMQSLHTLELKTLPYIKELPAWLGDTGAAPLALSCKRFQVQDGRFCLTTGTAGTVTAKWQIKKIHEIAMKKVDELDYEGALAYLCPANLGVLEAKSERFLSQERGIARRFTGDLQGALEDLTAALQVSCDEDDGHEYMYDCWKHRGYVKFLLGDLDGARRDGAMASKLLPEYDYDEIVSSPSLGERSVAYMDFRLVRMRDDVGELWELMDLSHSQLMDKVRVSDFHGAMACWNVTDASAYKPDLRLFFLQESGILKRLGGDLCGALQDLSTALEIYETKRLQFSDPQDMKYCAYNCLKHRGFVKFLLGDLDGAKQDGATAWKLISCKCYDPSNRLISPNLGEELITYMHFRLHPRIHLPKQMKLKTLFHNDVMDKVRNSDFLGALTIWEDLDARIAGYFDRILFLQERGVLKRLVGDLQGALDDLTAAVEVLAGEGDDQCCKQRCWDQYMYNCRKHLGYVNFLLGNLGRAQDDGAKALKLLWENYNLDYSNYKIAPSLGEESVTYLNFTLIGKRDVVVQQELMASRHSQVMDKVMMSDFLGALPIWCDLAGRVSPYYDRVFFLQEKGILRRMAGDLPGALEDLTAALDILNFETWPGHYELFKHRGCVKYLMGDEDGARSDAERCLAMEPVVGGRECLGGFPVAFLEFRLKGRKACEQKFQISAHKQVKEKVQKKDFVGALAVWDDFRASAVGYFRRDFFLRERGILRRMAGDLPGALKDLTVALEIGRGNYDCFKHRAYVKFLLGDIDGARIDAKQCFLANFRAGGTHNEYFAQGRDEAFYQGRVEKKGEPEKGRRYLDSDDSLGGFRRYLNYEDSWGEVRLAFLEFEL